MHSEAVAALSTTPLPHWQNANGADNALSTAIHRPFTSYLNVIFVLQTILFALLLYVLSMSANRAAITAYRWCMLANIVSVYGFQLGLFLSKPILAGRYLATYGLVDDLHSKGIVVCLFGMIFFATAHIVAMQFCIYYQYARLREARLMSSDLLDRVYESRGRFFTCYLLVTVATGLVFAVSFATCEFWFDAKDLMLPVTRSRPVFLDRADAVLRLRMPTAVKYFGLLAFFLLVASYTTLMTYCCLNTYAIVFRSGGYRSDRTGRMQLALFKSLVAQTTCIVACYALPLSLIIYVNFVGSPYGYSILVSAHYVMYAYSPLNYAMIFVFAKQFRTEVLRLFTWAKCTPSTNVGIHFVSMTR